MLTRKNLYNILPDDNFMSFFTRIKRKIPYSNVRSMTVSRFGHEFAVHVDKEHDYRFSSPNMKMKIVETLVDMYCKYHNKKMALYYYDDLTLESYTTTIDDVTKQQKKPHSIEPLYLDAESMKVKRLLFSKVIRPKPNQSSFLKTKIVVTLLIALKNFSYLRCSEEELLVKLCFV